jgi:NADH:ubiquinone oxidoreductase subunit 6 (subunit J)
MDSKITSHIIKGAILSGISIVISILVYVFNLYEASWLSWVNYGIFIGGLIYGGILFANQSDNNVSFGEVFTHGFKTTSVVIVITVLFSVLSIKVIFPDMVDKVVEITRKKMLENPNMTDDMIEKAVNMTKQYFLPFAIGGAIIGTGILGALGSLLGAAFAKKNPNPFKDNVA